MIDQMINQPLWMLGAILILSLLDHYLTFLGSQVYRKSLASKVEYANLKESSSLEGTSSLGFTFKYIWLKVLLILVILVIWIEVRVTRSQTVGDLYLFVLGFAFFDFLILDLRHLQSILISRYAHTNPQSISGKISYQRSFSLMQSAFQLLLPFALTLAMFIFHPSYFLFGALLAPFFLIARNIYLARRVKV